MWVMLVVGLAVQVAGCITAVAAIPRTDPEPTGPVEKGNRVLMVAGLLGLGLGGVLSLIAVIAFGVLMGLRAHANE